MIYLREFETQAAYNAAKSSLVKPNVALTIDNNEVHYLPDPTNGHAYVEIGGLKWATMNVGATGITDTGLYFAWGDTKGYTAAQVGTDKNFSWVDYKYGNGTSSPGYTGMTKYNSTDGKTVLDTSDDAARANMGGAWRMPTTAEFQALGTACKFIDGSGSEITGSNKLTTLSGVTGIYLEDKTDSSKRLFFPACGIAINGSVNDVGSYGYYWSGSLNGVAVYSAHYLYFYSWLVNWKDYYYRFRGYAVRGVLAEN